MTDDNGRELSESVQVANELMDRIHPNRVETSGGFIE